LSTTQNTAEEVTGGYIFKIDKETGSGGLGWTSSYRPLESSWQTVYYQYEYPKAEEITTQQRSYIQNYVYSF